MNRCAAFLTLALILCMSGLAKAQCCCESTAFYQPQTVFYAAAPAVQTVYYAPATVTHYAPATTVYYAAPVPQTVYFAPAPVSRPLVGSGITRVSNYTPAVTMIPANTVYYRAW